jgi:phosphinothricin acetyltransferase
MEFTLRPATPDDIAAISAIYNDAVLTTTASYDHNPEPLSARELWFEEHRETGFPVLVAQTIGPEPQVVGWGSLSSFRQKTGYRYTVENSIYIAAEARGQGIGKAMLAELIREARRIGMHAIVAGIDSEAAVSLRLHEQAGFVKVGHLPEVGYKFGRWLDVVFLEMRL